MGRIPARFITWGIASTVLTFAVGVGLMLWLEASFPSDGPGAGLGLVFGCGLILTFLLIVVFIGTVLLGISLHRSRQWFSNTYSYVFLAGAAYSVAAVSIILAAIR